MICPNALWSLNDFSQAVHAVDTPSRKRDSPDADFTKTEFCSKRN